MVRPFYTWKILACFIIYFVSVTAVAGLEGNFNPGRVSFNVDVNGVSADYHTFFVPIAENDQIELKITDIDPNAKFAITVGDKKTKLNNKIRLWRWQVPPSEVKHYSIQVLKRRTKEIVTLKVFVTEPADNIENERLNGYRIGRYPEKPLNGDEMYIAPTGFIEVLPSMESIKISPHFTLGQFLCKQEANGVKYAALQPKLLKKLELVLEEINSKGVRADTFAVLSGFRTPFYNKAIGNVKYSRHVWGDAADIYIDVDGNGVMDDVNGDGKVNKADAAFIYNLVETMVSRPDFVSLVGGMGEYKANHVRGPFVHIDTRGKRARWGR